MAFTGLNRTPGVRPGTEEHKRDMKRLGAIWRGMDAAARAVYQNVVDESIAREKISQATALPLLHEGRAFQRRVRRRRASDAISSIENHRCTVM
eukprot:2300744-Pyramimonas_sp.AAC.1